MSQRFTLKQLHAVCQAVNATLLWRGIADKHTGVNILQVYAWGTPKRVTIQRRVKPNGSGVVSVSPTISVREAKQFLLGYAARLEQERCDQDEKAEREVSE